MSLYYFLLENKKRLKLSLSILYFFSLLLLVIIPHKIRFYYILYWGKNMFKSSQITIVIQKTQPFPKYFLQPMSLYLFLLGKINKCLKVTPFRSKKSPARRPPRRCWTPWATAALASDKGGAAAAAARPNPRTSGGFHGAGRWARLACLGGSLRSGYYMGNYWLNDWWISGWLWMIVMINIEIAIHR